MAVTAPDPDCLLALLGLSAGDNTCFPLPTGPTDYITDSGTGLYLDKAEGLRLAPAERAQPATDLYARLNDARALAAVKLRVELEAGRAKTAGIPLYQQRGTLGGQGNGALAAPGTPAKLTFATAARREGALRITRLQLFTDQAVANVPLLLDGVQVATIATNGPNGAAILPGGVQIPLDGNDHTLEAVLPVGVRIRGNKLFCFGCHAGSPWAVSVKNNLRDVSATTSGGGFALSLVEECTATPDFLCFATGKDDGQGTYRYPEIARYVGIALLYKAAELFTVSLLSSNATSRYTMLEQKDLGFLAAEYAKQATQYIAWLNSPNGLGQVQHPCFWRATTNQPGKIWTG